MQPTRTDKIDFTLLLIKCATKPYLITLLGVGSVYIEHSLMPDYQVTPVLVKALKLKELAS